MPLCLQSNPTLYDAWEHLCGDSFDDPNRGSIAVITAYFDASYNQPRANSIDSLVYTVACYFASTQSWAKFRKEWRTVLQKNGLSRDFHFHMNEFEYAYKRVGAGHDLSKNDPYYGWRISDFDRLLDQLHRVINRKAKSNKPRLGPFQVGVIRPDFDDARPRELKNDPECKSYYIFCVSAIMDAIGQWADENDYHYPVHYIFAKGDKEGGNLDRLFDYYWKHEDLKHRFRLGKGYSRVLHSMQFSAVEPALQAADIAAYELNKFAISWIEKGLRQVAKSDLRNALKSLARNEHFGWLFTKDQLSRYFAVIPSKREAYPVIDRKRRERPRTRQ
jgi:hypothetical protein